MKALSFRETCEQYTVTRNSYGDTLLSHIGSLSCMYRDITGLAEGNHAESQSDSGIFWFPSDSTIKIGDVVLYNSVHFKISSVNVSKARLTTDATHFLKCGVSILRQLS